MRGPTLAVNLAGTIDSERFVEVAKHAASTAVVSLVRGRWRS